MMENKHKLLEQIESYLSNKMQDDEKALFEQKMFEDESLKKKVEDFKIAQNAILAKGRDALKASVDAAFNKSQHSKKPLPKIFTLQRTISGVAAALIIAVSAYFLWPNHTTLSAQELFTLHYEIPAPPNVRSSDEGLFDVWNRAIAFINAKKYPEYIETIAPVINNPSFEYRNEGYLFLGLSQLELDNYKEALSAFEKVSRASISSTDADWYTALTYLKMDDLGSARDLLKKISSANQQRSSEAREILKSISN